MQDLCKFMHIYPGSTTPAGIALDWLIRAVKTAIKGIWIAHFCRLNISELPLVTAGRTAHTAPEIPISLGTIHL